MEITLNGEKKILSEPMDVYTLLDELNITKEGTIVLKEGEIIGQEEYNQKIYEGSEIEILRFVSGG